MITLSGNIISIALFISQSVLACILAHTSPCQMHDRSLLSSTCPGELSGPGAELLVRFHTSSEDRPRYTIRTHGDTDMIVALLGPDDSTRVIQ